jgi:chromosome segregation ATPase
VDEEIKTYITGHKHDLMSGMQDVATLATRYQELESTAHKLRTSIDKMQRETSESYELVRSRTMELERIHETSIVLKQLRQFNHAKAQLDHYTQEATDLSGVKGLVFSFLPPPSLWSPTTDQEICVNIQQWQRSFKNLKHSFDLLHFHLWLS